MWKCGGSGEYEQQAQQPGSPQGPTLVLWRPGTSAQLYHPLVVCLTQMICISRLRLLPFKGRLIQLISRGTDLMSLCRWWRYWGIKGLGTGSAPRTGSGCCCPSQSPLPWGHLTHSSSFSLTGQWSILSSGSGWLDKGPAKEGLSA